MMQWFYMSLFLWANIDFLIFWNDDHKHKLKILNGPNIIRTCSLQKVLLITKNNNNNSNVSLFFFVTSIFKIIF